MIKNYWLSLSILFLVGCGCNSGHLYSPEIPPKPPAEVSNIIVTKITHTENSPYYTNQSNTSYYQAIMVKNIGETITNIKDINLSNKAEFTLLDPNDINFSNYYPASLTKCQSDLSLSAGQECEILVKLVNPTTNTRANTQVILNLLDDTFAQVDVTKHPYAYIAGDFSQTYNTNPLINHNAQTGYYCGQNQDSPCSILEYDLVNNSVKDIASTNMNINSIVTNDDGVLFIAGAFNRIATSQQQLVISGSVDSSLIVAMNPKLNYTISDLIHDTQANNYPDYDIYTMAYHNNKLYLAGGFQNIANLHSADDKYPLVSYDFKNNLWSYPLGDDNNNPDASISAIAFDNNNTLYLSGYYGGISNFTNANPFGIFSLNKCNLSNGTYLCNDNSNSVAYLNSTNSYIPATSLIVDNLTNKLFLAGGFSSVDNIIKSSVSNNYVITEFDTVNNWNQNVAPPILMAKSDRPIGVVSYTSTNDDPELYVGGWFSTIGNLISNPNEVGQCGPSNDEFTNGVNSCMLAQYNKGTNIWTKLFSTNGVINSFTISSSIE